MDEYIKGDIKKILEVLKDLNLKDSNIPPEIILENELKSYSRKFDSIEAREFFHNLVSAYLIEHTKHFKNYDLEVNYRFKSQKSTADKIIEYMVRDDRTTIGENQEVSIDKIFDAFAMKAILKNRPSTFHSSDPKINELVKEKINNQEFMTNMQKFQNQLTEDEFSINSKPVYRVTKKEYYTKCIEMVDRIIQFLSRENIEYSSKDNLPTEQIDKYNSIKEDLQTTLEIVEHLPDDTLIDETDYPSANNSSADFTKLFNKFSTILYNYIDLEILTRQSISIFKDSELMKKLGIEFVKTKEKRTSNGYISNFIYLKTPLGIVELQVQPDNAHKEGNKGDQAHNDMGTKKLATLKIPSLDNIAAIKKFKKAARFLSPKYYKAVIDSIDDSRVRISGSSLLRNYEKVIRQVKKGSPQDILSKSYFKTLKNTNILDSSKRRRYNYI